MVFYFKVRPDAGDLTIYMGLDKFENEQLIKYGFPEDIWFHVDKLSSAHVYLRLRKGQGIDDVTPEMLEDCAQLVKANSIMGNKLNNIDVVYTPWANLRKAASMDVGQIGFHNPKAVRSVRVEKRLNEVVNRLNKTKVEKTPDLQAEKEARDAEDRAARKAVLREQARREQEEKALKMRQAELRSYKGIMRVWARRESLGGMVLAASCCVLALNLSAQRRALGEAQRALAEALVVSHVQADLLEAERRSAEATRRAEAEIRGELRRLRAEMRREAGKAGWGLAERIRALAGKEEGEGEAGEQGEGERAGGGEDGEERIEEGEKGDRMVSEAANKGQQQAQQTEEGSSGREGEGGIAGSEPSAAQPLACQWSLLSFNGRLPPLLHARMLQLLPAPLSSQPHCPLQHSLWHASGRYFHSMGVFPLCSMDACFNYSRCPADQSSHEPLVYSYWPGQHYFKKFNESRWHTDDPAKACFFFVHMARGQPNEFADLENWGENGANHVLISAPEFKALHNGKDVVVLTRCGGSTNARILAEEPSLKPECDEDAKLYTQYDFADVMNTTFTLAPAGRQGSTYRFLEALTVGAIPVVVTDN
ncbi:unnamed protein product [Closterium sp. Naga37s-1]|nr:unnamed protein product [Closterium sp. Naga37s-1]